MTRITGDEFKQVVREYFDIDGRHWFHGIARQLDADADLAKRLARAERERDQAWRDVAFKDDGWSKAQQECLAAAAAVAELAAIERVRGHGCRDEKESFGWRGNSVVYCYAEPKYTRIDAPTMSALADKLDALRPVKEPEVWRWRFGDGGYGGRRHPTAAACRAEFPCCTGYPVREIIQPDGSILLVPERAP